VKVDFAVILGNRGEENLLSWISCKDKTRCCGTYYDSAFCFPADTFTV